MPTPIVICDDSSLARKQLARALPPGWDVTVALAANGVEALQAVRAGRGDILFLDLTMPEMDGFDVLEAIRSEDLQTLVIVVSGDIQPESQRRVKQLGAVAFLKKPVNPDELCQVLEEYGVLGILTGAGAVADTPVEFTDWCQEMANVAMGRAADLLAKVTTAAIELSIPKVNLLSAGELNRIAAAEGDLFYVSQGFIGHGISGETLMVFHSTDTAALAPLLHYGAGNGVAETEVLMDVANVLVGAFLKGLSELLDVKFSVGQPRLRSHGAIFRPAADGGGGAERKVLTIEIGYALGERKIRCRQLLLITEGSINALQDRAQMATA